MTAKIVQSRPEFLRIYALAALDAACVLLHHAVLRSDLMNTGQVTVKIVLGAETFLSSAAALYFAFKWPFVSQTMFPKRQFISAMCSYGLDMHSEGVLQL